MSGKRGPNQRIVALQVDVIGNDDQSSLLVFEVNAAGGISQDDGMNIHLVKDAHGEGDFAGRIAFVEMDASLHGCYRNATSRPKHHLPRVSDGG